MLRQFWGIKTCLWKLMLYSMLLFSISQQCAANNKYTAGEFHNDERFEATCDDENNRVLIREAFIWCKYSGKRRSQDRRNKTDKKIDVQSKLARMCLGDKSKTKCVIPNVLRSALSGISSACPDGGTPYLEINYQCAKAASYITVKRCRGVVILQNPDTRPAIVTACSSEKHQDGCVWTIAAKNTNDLVSVEALDWSALETQDCRKTTYGKIGRNKYEKKLYHECPSKQDQENGIRKKHVFFSKDNLVNLNINTGLGWEGIWLLIIYKVVLAADRCKLPFNPPYSDVTVTGTSTVVTCRNSKEQRWVLKCKDDVLIGNLSSCDRPMYPASEAVFSQFNEWIQEQSGLLIGFAFIIIILLCCCFFCYVIVRLHRTVRTDIASLRRPDDMRSTFDSRHGTPFSTPFRSRASSLSRASLGRSFSRIYTSIPNSINTLFRISSSRDDINGRTTRNHPIRRQPRHVYDDGYESPMSRPRGFSFRLPYLNVFRNSDLST